MFEHASDARILLKLLESIKAEPIKVSKDLRYVRVEIQENDTSASQDGLTPSSSVSTNLSSLEDSQADDSSSRPYLISINSSFIDLVLRANGKADLYFHAYLWYLLIQTLYFNSKSTATDSDFDSEIV